MMTADELRAQSAILRGEIRGLQSALDEALRQGRESAREVERQRQEMSKLRDDVRALEADKANLEFRLKGVQELERELEREREELMQQSTPRGPSRGILLTPEALTQLLVEAEAGEGKSFAESVEALVERHGRIVLPPQDFYRIQAEVEGPGRVSPALKALAERHGKKP